LVYDIGLRDEPELLEAVSAAAGIALENGRLEAELRARLQDLHGSRTRVVEAQQTERRRLERNLHDGAQQRLVALVVQLRLIREAIDSDPPVARSALDSAITELREALEELRELARGIHPAVLTNYGLGRAVAALAARSPVPVEITAMPEERLPAPVEAAAYYIVAEAITNVAKYAAASHITVTVGQVNGCTRVEVTDNGVGGADPAAGSGLRGIADRVEVLNGRLQVMSPVGVGTTVRAEIPRTAQSPSTEPASVDGR
jgi:signal transduction histidine kinase